VLNNLLTLKEHALFNPSVREQFNEALTVLSRQVREQKLVEVYGVHGGFAWLNPKLVGEMQAAVVKKMSTDPMAEMSLLEQIFAWEGLEGNLLQVNNFLFHTAQTFSISGRQTTAYSTIRKSMCSNTPGYGIKLIPVTGKRCWHIH
jgi:hypothetical protein